MLRATFDGQIDQHLADHRREFESVPGKTGSKRNVLVIGKPVNDEVMIRGKRVHADRRTGWLRIDVRQAFAQKTTERFTVSRAHSSFEPLGIRDCVAPRMLGRLEGLAVAAWESVKETVGHLEIEGGRAPALGVGS